MKKYIRSAITIDDLASLSSDNRDDCEYMEYLAGDPSTPPEVLAKLAEVDDWGVRQSVVHNPNIPPEVLAMLADDRQSLIRIWVAEHPNTPVEVLAYLAKDRYEDVRVFVAENPNTPPEVLAYLAQDWHLGVKTRVAQNPNTPPEGLAYLADHYYGDDDILHGVANNPNTPPEVLAKVEKSIKRANSSKKMSWKTLQKKLEEDCEDFDPLYEETNAGSNLESIMQEVENQLSIWLEPSIQAGSGDIRIYSSDNDLLAEGIDYQDFNDQAIDLALTSNSKQAFKTAYKSMLEKMMKDYKFDIEFL